MAAAASSWHGYQPTASGDVAHDASMDSKRARIAQGQGMESLDQHELLQLTDSKLSGRQFGFLAFGLCIGMFLAILDTSIVATSLLAIANELASLEIINWVALSYTLALLGFAVFLTQLADLIGRWSSFVLSCAIFFAASLACGFARNMGQLIAFRAVQGIGGSGLTSLALVIMPEVAPMRHTHLIGGLCGLVVAGAGILGPILGGALAHLVSWRWIFWINAPIVAIAAAVFCIAWPRQGQVIKPDRKLWAEMDVPGSFLLIAAAVLTVFAFQNAATDPQQWSRAIFLAPFLGGIALWASFGVWETLLERNSRMGKGEVTVVPTWPISLLGNRAVAGGALCTAFTGFAFFMVIFALPLRFQIVNNQSPLMAGVLLLPLLAATAIGSAFGSAVNAKENRLFETILAGCLLAVLGCGLLSTLSSSQSVEAKGVGFEVFVGLGNGLVAAGVTTLAALESSIRDQAVAQGIIAQARVLGGSLGIAASSAILSRKAQIAGAGAGQLEFLHHGAGGSNATSEGQRTLAREIYARAFTDDMYIGLAVALLGASCSLGIYRRRRMTPLEHRNAKIREEINRRQERFDPDDIDPYQILE